MIALFSWICSSVTAQLRTVGRTIDVGVVGVIDPWVNKFNRIALFSIEIIDNTITTTLEETVGTTVGIWCIGVQRSIITLFNSVNNTITAVRGTGGRASGIRSIGSSIITLFVVISVSITACWVGTVYSALRWVDSESIECSIIALFTSIENTITTEWVSAVGTARVGSCVAVLCSVVALFTLRIKDTVTAL
jgi:hypothetical protein